MTFKENARERHGFWESIGFAGLGVALAVGLIIALPFIIYERLRKP